VRKKAIEVLQWPLFSLDSNPIEHLWDKLERKMKRGHPKTRDELKQFAQQGSDLIDTDITQNLADSVLN
jgi:transposase